MNKEEDKTSTADSSGGIHITAHSIGAIGAIGERSQSTAQNVAGGDINIGAGTEQLADAFAKIYEAIQNKSFPSDEDKQEVREIVELIEEENKKGEEASEKATRSYFRNLARMAPDIWEVVIDTLTNPVKGISTVVKKIAEKAKEDQA